MSIVSDCLSITLPSSVDSTGNVPSSKLPQILPQAVYQATNVTNTSTTAKAKQDTDTSASTSHHPLLPSSSLSASSAVTSKKRPFPFSVTIPSDLESLDKPALIALVHALDQEREYSSHSKRTSTVTPPSEKRLESLKTKLTKKCKTAIGKCKISNQSSKPWVEVHEGMDEGTAKALVEEHGTLRESKSKSQKYLVRQLDANDVTKFLPLLNQESCHAVWTGVLKKPKGEVEGKPSKIPCPVAFEKAEFKYDHTSNMLLFRLRLVVCATNRNP